MPLPEGDKNIVFFRLQTSVLKILCVVTVYISGFVISLFLLHGWLLFAALLLWSISLCGLIPGCYRQDQIKAIRIKGDQLQLYQRRRWLRFLAIKSIKSGNGIVCLHVYDRLTKQHHRVILLTDNLANTFEFRRLIRHLFLLQILP
ncbi:MAG: hypothetical protein ACO2ZM_08945 [Francisellaceae bacterium]